MTKLKAILIGLTSLAFFGSVGVAFGQVANGGVNNNLIKLSGTTIVPANPSWSFSGSGAAQSPWTENINGATFNLANVGTIGVGTSSPFQGALSVDSGTSSTTNTFLTGNVNNFMQMNVMNRSAGAAASGDLVITSDNGSDTSYYVNLGRNSSTNSDANYTLFAAGDSYLYDNDNSLNIGVASSTNSNAVLKFFTGGTLVANERMRITSSGNVGIGTTTPFSQLSISTTTQSSGSNSLFAVASTTNDTLFNILGSGMVGIASSSPTQPLSVGGNVLIGAPTAGGTNGTLTYGNVTFANTVTGTGSLVGSAAPVFTGIVTAASIRGGSSVSTAGLITATNSGVPTTANLALGLTSSAATGFSKLTFGIQGLSLGTTTGIGAGSFDIASSSTSNTFKPQLVVTDSAAGANLKHWSMTSEGGNFYLGVLSDQFATSSIAAMSILQNGNIGIATSTPWRVLSSQGSVALNGLTAFATGDSAVCQRAGGEITVDSGISSCIVSSQFVKHDITFTDPTAAVSRIEGLVPVSFAYNDGNRPDLGLIAEKVALVDPRYAQYATATSTVDGHLFKPGDARAINWSAITSDLVRVVQSILSRLDGDEKRLNAQQRQLDSLQFQINALKHGKPN